MALVANTPAFLYRRVNNSEYLQELAKIYSTEDLFVEIKRINEDKNKTPFSLATVYALLLALSLRDDFDLKELEQLDLSWVDWSEEIINIFINAFIWQ